MSHRKPGTTGKSTGRNNDNLVFPCLLQLLLNYFQVFKVSFGQNVVQSRGSLSSLSPFTIPQICVCFLKRLLKCFQQENNKYQQ